jgi:hypothetical protein
MGDVTIDNLGIVIVTVTDDGDDLAATLSGLSNLADLLSHALDQDCALAATTSPRQIIAIAPTSGGGWTVTITSHP